ncbi:MAG: SDR family NAD(P)-dependent oxidoreductase [Halothece sp.]
MTNDIAIIGLTGRFPEARNIDEFWENLKQGKEGITPLTEEELAQGGIPLEVYQKSNYVKASPRLKDDIAGFDADFFGYSPREAEMSDPQQRLFLEVAWEALETAGCNPETTSQRVGVFAGVGRNTYLLYNLHHKLSELDSVGAFQTLIGNDKDFLATRISYLFNLTGASVTVQTACSTSLVAVHCAVSSLLNGENDIALAGGVSVKVPHLAGYHYQDGGIYSPDGHCRSFDAKAQGTVGGSGAGIVVLKRLEDAQADGNTIYAVIKGSAVNNDGATKVGYTAPSVEGQASAIAEALLVSDIDPTSIQYVEAHGTATPLGDPIEVQALTEAFQTGTQKTGFCALGSVKSNVGHLDAAAGVTGLIKTVLSLYHQAIPPSLHFQEPNPEIDFDHSPFYVNTTLQPWQRKETPRRAGVSAFGIGGTNAHVVLEEAPPSLATTPSYSEQLLLLSAKTENALDEATENLSQYVTANPDLNLADVAYTLNTTRKAFPYRGMAVGATVDSLVNNLHTTESCFCQARSRSITFLFPGQGTQQINMARELYQSEAVFQETVDQGAEILQPFLNLDLREILYPPETTSAAEQLTQTQFAQPALFLIEYSLAKLWQSWGIQPEALIGHSIGEYVAACLAGVMSFPDALQLVAKRGQLMQSLPKGRMLSVNASATEIKPLLNDSLALAVINSPQLCVVSGEEDAISQFQSQLEATGINSRLLHTSHAFHSPMMNPIVETFVAEVGEITLHPPKIPFISNLSGTWITAKEATDHNYWGKQLRQTVQFSAGVETLLQQECIFLEVGPSNTLSTLIKQHSDTATVISSLPHPKAKTRDRAQILQALGELWLNGISPDWSAFYQQQRRQLLPLPTYPFQRQRYWINPPHQEKPSLSQLEKTEKISEWFYVPSWQRGILPPERQFDDCWLIFLDETGLGEALVKQLAETGSRIITVAVGEGFTQLGENSYRINPDALSDYETLLERLRDRFPDHIVHLWTVSPLSVTHCFNRLLFLVQALGKQDLSDSVSLSVISSGQYEVIGNEPLSPDKAVIQGICKVIPQEYPQIRCRLIDLNATEIEQGDLSELLHRELTTVTSDPIIAYRHGYRWRQTFNRASVTAETESLIKAGGVYLITGGLGGIGLSLASHIAQTPQTKLVLLSRSGLPDREEWEDWLTGEETDPQVREKIRQIQTIEEKGSEVLVLTGDVSDRASMASVIEQSETQFGKINGVIHTAGVAGGGIMQLKTPEAAKSVLAAKVEGTKILNDLLGDQLDFMILNSSLSSQIGGVGQVDYCAANAFLDSFAHYYSRHGKRAIAINWDTWQEVGMAVNTPVPEMLQQQREESLAMGISPREGKQAFQRLQGLASAQVIVCTKDLPTLIQRSTTPQSLTEKLATLSTKKPDTSYPRPDLNTPYVTPRNETETIVAATWEQFLGISPVGVNDDFFELGGHSLLATEIISSLRDRFQQELPLNRLFETPTVAGLASLISTEENHQSSEIQPSSDETEELISELNQLSDSEVDSLLNQMLTSDQ